MHNDNLAFEYYSKGDLLLSDSGEVKYRQSGYGPIDAKGHNILMINNGTGEVGGLTKVLYPNKEYFVVLDDLLGTQTRQIDTLFHLGSLNITPTTYSPTVPGYVHGDLWIDRSATDWLSQTFGDETTYGNANLIKWKTTSGYTDKPVELYLFSSPKSEVTVEKFWTRIAGYSKGCEVDHPIIRFKINDSTMHRVTAIYAINPDEEQAPSFEETTNNDFTSLHITTSDYDDYIASGNNISLPTFSTDGKYVFLGTQSGNLKSFFMREASSLLYNGAEQIETSKIVEHIDLKYEGENRTFHIKGEGTDVNITLYQMNPSITYQVKRDGVIYTDWIMTDSNTKMVITTDLSEHTFEIEPTTPDTTPPTTTVVITPTPSEKGWINATSAIITFFRSDDFGVAYTNYSMASETGPWATVTGSEEFNITITNEGTSTVWYYSVDVHGNVEQVKNLTVKIDYTAPIITNVTAANKLHDYNLGDKRISYELDKIWNNNRDISG